MIFISNFQFAIFMQHFALALSWSFEFTLMVFPFYCSSTNWMVLELLASCTCMYIYELKFCVSSELPLLKYQNVITMTKRTLQPHFWIIGIMGSKLSLMPLANQNLAQCHWQIKTYFTLSKFKIWPNSVWCLTTSKLQIGLLTIFIRGHLLFMCPHSPFL